MNPRQPDEGGGQMTKLSRCLHVGFTGTKYGASGIGEQRLNLTPIMYPHLKRMVPDGFKVLVGGLGESGGAAKPSGHPNRPLARRAKII